MTGKERAVGAHRGVSLDSHTEGNPVRATPQTRGKEVMLGAVSHSKKDKRCTVHSHRDPGGIAFLGMEGRTMGVGRTSPCSTGTDFQFFNMRKFWDEWP